MGMYTNRRIGAPHMNAIHVEEDRDDFPHPPPQHITSWLIDNDDKMYGIRIRSLPTLLVGLKTFFSGNRIGYFESVPIEVQDFW